MFYRFLSILVVSSLSLFAKDEKADFSKVSEALGHMISKNMKTLGLDLNMDLVIKGLKDATSGKESPMTEAECSQAITVAIEEGFKVKADENLKQAESFLTDNSKKAGVIALENGKLQYKIEHKGTGALVEPTSRPIIRYVGKHLDGTVFGQSTQDETISLEETIPGFSKGLVGMHEGEKRILFIHPDYGYGTKGFLPPNSLLTFEIEIVKANAPVETAPDALIMQPSSEVKVSADKDAKVVR